MTTSAVPAAGRRVELDRLRIAACLSTFCYHAIQVFDLNPYYHLKSHTLSPTLDVAARLLHAVRMPLFFLIAGMALALALASNPARSIMRERAWRLLPPFLVGIVLLTPFVKYFEVLDGRSIAWSGIVLLDGPAPELTTVLRRYFTQLRWFSWSHMWFPLYLLLLTWLLLGGVRRLLAGASARPAGSDRAAAALILFLAALVAVEVVLRPFFPWHIPNLFWDWASVAVYATSMLAGAMLVAWPTAQALLRRGVVALAVLAGAGAVLYLGAGEDPLRATGRALWLWGCLGLTIGIGPRLAAGRVPGERYLSEGALPIYVLHHVPLIGIAFVVKDLPWPVPVRWLVIVLGAFATTLAVYHVAVRPFDAIRFAFGMPPQRRQAGSHDGERKLRSVEPASR